MDAIYILDESNLVDTAINSNYSAEDLQTMYLEAADEGCVVFVGLDSGKLGYRYVPSAWAFNSAVQEYLLTASSWRMRHDF